MSAAQEHMMFVCPRCSSDQLYLRVQVELLLSVLRWGDDGKPDDYDYYDDSWNLEDCDHKKLEYVCEDCEHEFYTPKKITEEEFNAIWDEREGLT